MDFTFNEEQRAVRDAASGVFAGMVTPARVAEVEAGDERIDRELWSALAASDLLGLAVPERSGGAGLGLLELCSYWRPRVQSWPPCRCGPRSWPPPFPSPASATRALVPAAQCGRPG